jgi:CRISPR-associated exonuclease Cas4
MWWNFIKCEDGIKTAWTPRTMYSVYPVEYKKGKPKLTEEDKLQLGSPGNVLGRNVLHVTDSVKGAIFYGETRRREAVEITEELRQEIQGYVSGNASVL